MNDFAHRASWRFVPQPIQERPGWHSFVFLMAFVMPIFIYILIAK